MLTYTLLSDGSSDRSLLPILTWLMESLGVNDAIQSQWADLRVMKRAPKSLSERICSAVRLYPSDLLFIHRDAENETLQTRSDEIRQGLQAAIACNCVCPPAICVVPVRMQEAWLLFSEESIRRAAGNPNDRIHLEIPALNEVERIPDPKGILYGLLKQASGLRGRHLKQFRENAAAIRVADYIDDFSPLRKLSSFAILESELQNMLQENHWN